MSFNIRRVSILPKPLEANTIYFHPADVPDVPVEGVVVYDEISSAGNETLVITIVGDEGLVIYSSPSIYRVLQHTETIVTRMLSQIDLGASSEYVANIAARDALVQKDGSLVLVADATGDATVTSGSALYFCHLPPLVAEEYNPYIKVAEYESMDLSFPGQAIVNRLSDVNGELYFDNKPVAAFISNNSQF